MTTPAPLAPMLQHMPSLAELFRLFLSGKHLNRVAEPALWAELEAHQDTYTGLFAALGFELRVDARGFAWFHSSEANANIGDRSRKFALLFMVVFDVQANAGKALQRFTDWLLDRQWLGEAYEAHKDLLSAEGLDADGLADLLGRASTMGFAVAEPAGWRLLPAVCRYLDHFESLAAACQEFAANSEADNETASDPDEALMDMESD